jgi:hypothetical protein
MDSVGNVVHIIRVHTRHTDTSVHGAFRDLISENKGIEQIDLTGVDIDLPNDKIVAGTYITL